jgi:hypothetical protein
MTQQSGCLSTRTEISNNNSLLVPGAAHQKEEEESFKKQAALLAAIIPFPLPPSLRSWLACSCREEWGNPRGFINHRSLACDPWHPLLARSHGPTLAVFLFLASTN